MRAYEFAVYLGILGMIVGGISVAMSYTDHNWFPSVDAAHEATITQTGHVTTSDMQNQSNSLLPSTDISDATTTQKTVTAGTVIWKMITGIFYVKAIIDDTIKVPDPNDPSKNLFSYFSDAIQIGIYAVYGIGILQYWSKFSVKYAE